MGQKSRCIEKSKNNLPLAQRFINKAGLSDKINILFGEAEEIMASSSKKYDFIFLDADKTYYQSLFLLSLNLLTIPKTQQISSPILEFYLPMQILPSL